MASAVVTTTESSVDKYIKKIQVAQTDVDACLRLIDTKREQPPKFTSRLLIT
jgi:hypothetical protein